MEGLRRALRRFDIHVSRWSWTMVAFRARLLNDLGVTTLYDLGANVGQYATLVREGGYKGQIISCEPVSSSFEALHERSRSDPRWLCHQLAIGAQDGNVTINVPGNTRHSSILSIDGRAETVPMLALDSLAEHIQGVVGVKADVQGYEGPVIDGGRQTLSRAVFLELELPFVPFLEGQETMISLLHRAEALGFTLALVENVGPSSATGRATEMNALFVRG